MENKHTYQDGKRDGLSQTWYGNGQLNVKRILKNDQEDGLSRNWLEDGRTIIEDTYKDVVNSSATHNNSRSKHPCKYKNQRPKRY
jgi:antitoxin component YwqK of YwqJK toxin-antitoxin module